MRTRPGYTANELNELYCLRCHDRMGIPICGACRWWRINFKSMLPALSIFFVFFRHQQILQLIANDCYVKHSQISQLWITISRRPIEGRVVTALGKHWCVEHFVCAKVNTPASTLFEWRLFSFEWRLFSRADDAQTLFAVREAFHGKPPLRAERPCLLWDPLPPGDFLYSIIFLFSLCSQNRMHLYPSYYWRIFASIRYISLQLFGNLCYVCNQVIQTDVFTALNKASN